MWMELAYEPVKISELIEEIFCLSYFFVLNSIATFYQIVFVIKMIHLLIELLLYLHCKL